MNRTMNSFEQMLLANYYTASEFQCIQNTKIGIAGAGGLGSNIAICLVKSGFKHFTIIDYDKVEISNLNRQVYSVEHIGKQKVDVLSEILLKINKNLELNIINQKLCSKNIYDYFSDQDILFEAFDKAEDKKMLFTAFHAPNNASNKLLIFGNGVVGTDLSNIKIERKFTNVFFVGDNKTSIDNGFKSHAPKVIACASLMAGVALKEILKRNNG